METNYEDYLKQVADLGGAKDSTNSFLETFLKTEYGEGYTYEGDLQNNLPNGNGALYYPKKQVYAIGEFSKGRLQDFSKTYYDDGKLWQEGEFVNGKLNGEGISHWDELKVYEKGNFKNGLLEGNGLLYLNNQLKCEGVFKSGVLKEGIIYDVKPNNKFIKNAKVEGVFDTYATETKTYIGKGKISYCLSLSLEETNFDSEGVITCPLIGYAVMKNCQGKIYRNGLLSEMGIFGEDGFLIDGKMFSEDGSLTREGTFILNSKGVNCLENGVSYSMMAKQKEGRFDVEVDFPLPILKKGKIYSDGQLWREGDFTYRSYDHCEVLHGEGIKYLWGDGSLAQEGHFQNDELNGKGIYYYSNNQIGKIGTFKNGKLEGSNCKKYLGEDFWCSVEKLPHDYQKTDEEIIDGLLRYKISPIKEEGCFKNGELHGNGRRYDSDGTLIQNGTFINGEFQGK